MAPSSHKSTVQCTWPKIEKWSPARTCAWCRPVVMQPCATLLWCPVRCAWIKQSLTVTASTHPCCCQYTDRGDTYTVSDAVGQIARSKAWDKSTISRLSNSGWGTAGASKNSHAPSTATGPPCPPPRCPRSGPRKDRRASLPAPEDHDPSYSGPDGPECLGGLEGL